ncbi:MAG: aldolase catalytic domain-containing protein [Opitutales bacterium]
MKAAPCLLDCTLRDGGYVNDWAFSQAFGRALYSALSEAGCDYVELGFLKPGAQKGLPWTNLSAGAIHSIRETHPQGARISVMVDYGSLELADIPPASAYPADLIRVAAPAQHAAEATEFAARIADKGYATSVNYMGISNYSNDGILALVDTIRAHKDAVRFFYVADSFGSLLPSRTREIFSTLRFGTDAPLGLHTHNNLQLALANSLEAMEAGVDILDGSVFGMGRGAGNLFTEVMLGYLETLEPDRFNLLPVLQFADLYMEDLKRRHSWGYSLPQLLSGLLRCHPNYPTNLLKEKAYTADDIHQMLKRLDEAHKPRFFAKSLDSIKQGHFASLASRAPVHVSPGLQNLCQRDNGATLLVCGGRSVVHEAHHIQEFIARRSLSLFSVNQPRTPFPVDGVFFGNRRRILEHSAALEPEQEVILSPEIHAKAERQFGLRSVSRVNALRLLDGTPSPFANALPTNSAIHAILGLVQCGYRTIYLCGLDGYDPGQPAYYASSDAIDSPEEVARRNAVIESELDAAEVLGRALGFSFSIITRTRFARHAAVPQRSLPVQMSAPLDSAPAN